MPSLEALKKIATDLKGTGAKELEKEEIIQKEETKFIREDLLDLTQERLKLEKILQEINNLKRKICQRIEFIKNFERRKREIEKQLTSLGKENPSFSEETKKKLDNLREYIK